MRDVASIGQAGRAERERNQSSSQRDQTRQTSNELHKNGSVKRRPAGAPQQYVGHSFQYLERLRESVFEKLQLPEIYWASLYLPVVTHEASLDSDGNAAFAIASETFDRAAICQKLGVEDHPDCQSCPEIGKQLFKAKRLPFEESWLIDSDFFVGRIIDVELRLDVSNFKIEDFRKLLSQLQLQGAIAYFEEGHTHDGYLFVELVTANFIQLVTSLAAFVPDLVAIVSMDGQVIDLP